MAYKRLKDIPFEWNYKELMHMPLFMIDHIYHSMDQFIEEDKQRMNASKTQSYM